MKILDCTLRDGGYINNWRFNKDFTNNLSKLLNTSDVDLVEIGFINKTNNYRNKLVGNCRILDKNYIENFKDYDFKKVVMADFADLNIEILNERINVDLIRIAFHKKDLEKALETCNEIKKKGYKVSVNAMAITNYNKTDLEYLFDKINSFGLDILYIADSFGCLQQNDIKYYFELFDKKLNKNVEIGFHLHNNMNNAYGNYEYLKNMTFDTCREIIVDTTMFGMGRGAGNLQTELVLKDNVPADNIYQIMDFIQDYIKPIYKTHQNTWGYDIDYFLSGYLKMHPNYIVKMRDLEIDMKKRIFLIKKMKERDYDYNYFDIEIMNNFIEEYKSQLL